MRLLLGVILSRLVVGFERKCARRTSRSVALRESVADYLREAHPPFASLLAQNEKIWNSLQNPEASGTTIFAPNGAAFEALGEKKREQLKDPRNSEVTEKIGAYHVVDDFVSLEQLLNSGGVVTLAGDVAVGESMQAWRRQGKLKIAFRFMLC